MTNQYHATPYDLSATGFYFSSYDEYTEKAAKHRNAYGDSVEEYETQHNMKSSLSKAITTSSLMPLGSIRPTLNAGSMNLRVWTKMS
ncbi:MAG: hypothetical protein JKY34_04710 [Kordiimonadaceae bacterium]|nr:hypothetical protein [Kordiimonadaceae bacterium]